MLPDAVIKQQERSQRLLAEIEAAQKAESGEGVVVQEEPVAPVEPQPEPVAKPLEQPIKEPQVIQPASPVEPEPKSVEAAQKDQDLKRANARWKSEEGRRRKLEGQLAELQSVVKALETTTETLKKEREAIPTVSPAKRYLTEQDMELLDSDQLDATTKVATGIAEASSEKIQKELQDIKTSHNEQLASLKSQTFYNFLGSHVPNWQELNEDVDFLDWLGEQLPEIGKTRQSLLQDAERNFDAERAVYFFKQYTASKVSAEPAAEVVDPRMNQVSPKRVKASAPAQPEPTGRIWTQADINKFYQDLTKGNKYSADEEREIRDDISAAQFEGRYRIR